MDIIINHLIGLLVGGLITWLVARIYYVRASKDLTREAAELQRLNNLLLRGMEHAELVELNRDEQNKIVGFVIKLSASINAKTDTSKITVQEP